MKARKSYDQLKFLINKRFCTAKKQATVSVFVVGIPLETHAFAACNLLSNAVLFDSVANLFEVFGTRRFDIRETR